MTRSRIRPVAAAATANTALIVGNSASLTAGDTALQTMLTTHGLTVQVFNNNAVANGSVATSLIAVAPSASSASLDTGWKTLNCPMLVMGQTTYPNTLGIFTASTNATVSSASVKVTETYYTVAGHWQHNTTASTSASVANSIIHWPVASLIAGAIKYAEPSGVSTGACGVRVEKGAQLNGGGVAANRRVLLGITDASLIAGVTTGLQSGADLIDSAILWLLGRTTSMVRPAAPITNYAIPGLGTDRYVSPSGSDSNDGLTTSTPWLTLGKAKTSAPTTGTVIIRAGTYREGVIQQSTALTWQPYPGEQVIWSGLTDYKGSSWTNPATGQWYVAFDPTAQAGLSTEDISTAYSNSDNAELNSATADYHLGVQIDGLPLIMRTAANQLDEQSGWYDSTNKRIYIGKDPTTCTTIEITTQDRGLYINTSSAAGTKVRGILFTGFHTHANSDGFGGALVVSANSCTVESCIFHAGTGTGWTAYNNGLTTANVESFASGGKGCNLNNVDGWTRTGYLRDRYANRRRYSNSNGAAAGLAGIKCTNTQSINAGGSIVVYRAYGMPGLWFDLATTGEIAKIDCRENGRGPQGTGGGAWFEDGDAADVGDFVTAYNFGYGIRTGETGLIRFWNGVTVNNTSSQIDFYNGQNTTTSRRLSTAEFHNVVAACTDPSILPSTPLFKMRTNRSTPVEFSSTMLPANPHIGRTAFVRSTASQPTNVVTWLQDAGTSVSYATLAAFQSAHPDTASSAALIDGSSVDSSAAGSTLFTSDDHGGTTKQDPQGDYTTKASSSLHNAGEVCPDSTIGALLGKNTNDTLDIGSVTMGAYTG